MNYWLLKSEPDTFSLDDLEARKGRGEPWDGIRNYQARNYMRDDMKVGDLALFYHSNCDPPGVAGVARVIREARPDPTAWDERSKYYDPKSEKQSPRWMMVEVRFECRFPRYVSLGDMRNDDSLQDMLVLRKGSRLSITPVEKTHFLRVCTLGGLESVPNEEGRAGRAGGAENRRKGEPRSKI